METEPTNPTVRITSSDQRVDKGMNLDTQPTGGVVGDSVWGENQPSDLHDVSLNYDGGINPGASSENLSAKYKNGTQDVPSKGKNQYESAD